MDRKEVVVIGGGTGTFTVLSALKKYSLHLTAIVSMADDGGSTGKLRDEYGVLPPGDVRRALVALGDGEGTLRELFNFRYKKGSFKGHSFGNVFLSTLEQMTGSFARAVEVAGELLHIRGAVVPVTLQSVRLNARLSDGTFLRGESKIDLSYGARAAIAKIWLTPRASLNPKARAAILSADMIVIGPGDLFTSIVPNLLVRGMPEALKKSRARKLYVGNIMTKRGETDGFTAKDFLEVLSRYLGKDGLDSALFNNRRPPEKALVRYKKEGAEIVSLKGLTSTRNFHIVRADLLAEGRLARHDSKRKLSRALVRILNS